MCTSGRAVGRVYMYIHTKQKPTKQDTHNTHTHTFDSTQKMFVFTLDLNFGFIGVMACKNSNRNQQKNPAADLPVSGEKIDTNKYEFVFSLSLSLLIPMTLYGYF